MKLLILDTDNICRSPMAEGVVTQLIERYGLAAPIEVQSMGFAAHEDQHPTKEAVDVMAEIGMDISTHRAKRIMMEDLLAADICYVMTMRHKHILIDEAPEMDGCITVLDVPDPYGHGIETYRSCRDEINTFFEAEFRRIEDANEDVNKDANEDTNKDVNEGTNAG